MKSKDSIESKGVTFLDSENVIGTPVNNTVYDNGVPIDDTGYIDDSEKDDFEEYAMKALSTGMSEENSDNISIKSLVIFLREKNNKMSELIKSIGIILNRIDKFNDNDYVKKKDGSIFTMKDALVTLNNDYKRNLERIEEIEKFLEKTFK